MSWFKKDPPPPPEPPPSKVPMWTQIAVPIVFAVIMSLAAFSFNGYKSHAEMRMDENKAAVEKLQEQKVDNRTMQLMIELQKQQSESQKEDIKDLQTDVKQMRQNMEQVLQLLKEKK